MRKRITAVILLITQLMTVFALGGCKKSEDDSANTNSQTSTTFKSTPVPVPDGYEMRESLSYTDGKFSCLIQNNSREYHIFSFDENGENIDIQPFALNAEEDLRRYIPMSGGRYVTAESVTDNSGDFVNQRVCIFSPDGDVILSTSCDEIFGEGTYKSTQMGGYRGYFHLADIHSVSENEYRLITSMAVVGINLNGNVLYTIPSDTSGDPYMIDRCAVTPAGETVVIQVHPTSGQHKYGLVDFNENKIIKLPENIAKHISSEPRLSAGSADSYNLYFSGSDGIYGTALTGSSASEPVLIVSWIESNIAQSSVNYIYSLTPEKFVITAYDENYKNEIYILTMIPKDQIIEKTTVTIAHAAGYTPYADQILKFNKINEKYNIVTKDYSIYNDENDVTSTAGMQRFMNEIIAGDVPDMFYFNVENTFYDNLAAKGAFADLYTYLDNDPDVSRETLVPCVREPAEYQGKLYRLATSLDLSVFFSDRSDIPYDTWSYEKMFELFDSLNFNEDTLLANYPLYGYGPSGLQGYYMDIGLSDFIDYEKAEVSFDSEVFINLISHIKNQPNWAWGADESKQILTHAYIYSVKDYMEIKYVSSLSKYADEITAVPYPSTEEQPLENAGGVINFQNSFCIFEKGKNNDGAWEFLKYIMSEEVQDPDESWYSTFTEEVLQMANAKLSGSFPINQKSFDKYFEKVIPEYFYYENPNTTADAEERYKKIKVSENDIENIKKILYSSKGKEIHDIRLHDIVIEEMNEFMFGETGKTAEQTAKAIQSRANIFISETYG